MIDKSIYPDRPIPEKKRFFVAEEIYIMVMSSEKLLLKCARIKNQVNLNQQRVYFSRKVEEDFLSALNIR